MLEAYRKHRVVYSIAIACVLAIGFILPTEVAGWAPIAHFQCETDGDPVASYSAWVPAALVISPFGGLAWNNGTVPAGPLSSFPSGATFFKETASNGSAVWSGFGATVNVTPLVNQTVWGPGSNARCTQPYTLSFRYYGGVALGFPLVPAGNWTVLAEPRTLGSTPFPGTLNLTVSVGFGSGNTSGISTCGRLAQWSTPFQSTSIVVDVPFEAGGHSFNLRSALPFTEQFHYWFPANFGTWQVDNLSAPGGPSGGWAFSYSPCP